MTALLIHLILNVCLIYKYVVRLIILSSFGRHFACAPSLFSQLTYVTLVFSCYFSSVFLIEDVFTDDSSMKLVLKMKRKSRFISFPCFN